MTTGLETAPGMDPEFSPRRASEWLAALLERPDDTALRDGFDAWLAADPANRTDWDEIARTYEAMGAVLPAFPEELAPYAAGGQGPRPLPSGPTAGRTASDPLAPIRPPIRQRRQRRRLVAGGAMALAIAACVAFFALPAVMLRLQADHATTTAETRTVRLDDGSTVALGPESAIEVAYDAGARRLRLLRGVAYFDVVADPARPFTVAADTVTATVLGTAFEMRLDDGGADVTLQHGAVRVENTGVAPPVTARLEPGERVRMSWGGGIRRSGTRPAQIAAWRRGQLIVRDATVAEVVDRLRKYHDGVVILQGDTLARQPLTGIYNLSDPVTALEAVAGAQGARVYRLSDWVLVIAGD